ncbi:hypothetical protein RB597_009719 [Gaeumannomyces tritici]
MAPNMSWSGDAEKEMILAMWHSASVGPLKPDWNKTVAIMEARGFGFTIEAIKSRWFKKILKEYRALEGPEGAAKASPSGGGGKRKRVDDDDAAAAPSTPKRKTVTGPKTPESKRAKTPKAGIKSEPVDVAHGSGHGQQDKPSPERTPTALFRRSNPCRSATKSESYKDGSTEEDSFNDDSDVVV